MRVSRRRYLGWTVTEEERGRGGDTRGQTQRQTHRHRGNRKVGHTKWMKVKASVQKHR